MLKLDKLIVVMGEWHDRGTAYGGESTEMGTVEFDLRDYREFHAGAIAREILRLGGAKYSNYPVDNLRSYVANVIKETVAEVETNTSLVARVEWKSGLSGFPANDEKSNLTTDMTVVMVRG
jgi:hypothetical protein